MALDLFDILAVVGLIMLASAAYLLGGRLALLGAVGAILLAIGVVGAWHQGTGESGRGRHQR